MHIDGDHSFEVVYNELKNYYPKLKKMGIIVGDDLGWPSVERALIKFSKEFDVKYEGNRAKNYYIIIRNS